MLRKYRTSLSNSIVLLMALVGIILFCSRMDGITKNTAVSLYGVDLIAYHTAARLISQGADEEIYVTSGNDFSGVDTGKFSETARASGFEFRPTRYVYLPIFLVPFQLLGRLSFSDAAALFLSVNLSILLAVIVLQWRLIRGVFSPVIGLALVVVLNMMSFPVFYGLKLGQTTLTVYLCVCLIYYFTLKGRDTWAGFLLGLIVTLKYTPFIFILYFLYKKKYKLLISCFGTVVGLVLLSITIYGLPLHKSYWLFIKGLSAGGISGWSSQSILALLLRQFAGSSALSYELFIVSNGIFFLNLFAAGAVILATCYFMRRKKTVTAGASFSLEFSAIVLCFLIVPSVSWLHYFCIATLPALIIITRCLKTGEGMQKKIILSLVFISSCMILFYPNIYKILFILDKDSVTRLIISFPLIGAGVLLAVNFFMLGSARFFGKEEIVLSSKNKGCD